MSLPDLALRRPVTTVAATLALVLLGAVSLGRLPVSLLPDVTLPVLTIRTNYPGAAAPEVSRFITEPIEEAIHAGKAEWTYVTPGRSNGRETEILADSATGRPAVAAGDTVLVEGHLTLTHDAPVRLMAKERTLSAP
jgi:HAE1 family hydrophobic/amphiphilic exporter-1